MNRILLYLALVCLILMAAGLSDGFDIGWYAFTGGGGHAVAGNYTLDSAIGQPVVGTIANSTIQICAGFLCAIPAFIIYMPLTNR
jgi:hypothetical protein